MHSEYKDIMLSAKQRTYLIIFHAVIMRAIYKEIFAFGCVMLPSTDTPQLVCTIIKENRTKYEKHNDTIEQAIEDFEQNGPLEDAWTTLAPANDLDLKIYQWIEREE